MSAGPSRPEQTIPDWLRWRSSVSPNSLALKMGALEWSYGELQANVSMLSAVLLARGIEKGDRVTILARPSEGFVALVHALSRIGAVAVPLNYGQSMPELLSQILNSDPSLVVYDDALKANARKVEALERQHDRTGKRLAAHRWENISELMAKSTAGGVPVVGDGVNASSPHAIIYTSGSSGAPKGVQLSLENLMWNAISVGLRIGVSSEDRWLLCMPLFHVGGYSIIFRSLLHGSGIVLHPRFDARRASRSLDDGGITLVSFVPTMLSEILKVRGADPLDPRVRLIFLGGGQPSTHLLSEIRKRRLPVLLTYGMTETCSQVAVSDVGSSSRGPIYRPLLPSDVAVVRPGTKRRVAFARSEEVGEIAVRGPTLFSGYWRKPALTRTSFRGEWFLTGDLGVRQARPRRDASGSGGFAVLGRKEEAIVSGGEKIPPGEVEAALREHVAVKDAVVIGVADAKWGERVVAVVEIKPEHRDGRVSADELSAFLKKRVGRYKIPKRYHFWAAIPRTSTGKIRRSAIRLRLERDEVST